MPLRRVKAFLFWIDAHRNERISTIKMSLP
nr:MAG TPA: hypothetical protein [Caudoviricetes sp.]DAZ13356.1 MAG TPA: hypothetical protein [Caudoviricetes sp.]